MKTTHTDQLSSNAEDELRLVIDTIPGFVWSASPDGSIEFLNQRGLDYTGFSLVDSNGSQLRHGAAPSLPLSYVQWIDGRAIALEEGPCASAAFSKEPIIASDFESDDRWPEEYRALALAHGLRACWSTPILSQAGAVLGTFALYYHQPGSPSPKRKTSLTSLLISRASPMFEEIVGASSALQTVLARVAKVAPTDSTVLVTGEIPQSGTRSWLPAQFTRDHRAPATLLSA